MKLGKRIHGIVFFLLGIVYSLESFAVFIPADNYLIVCGSSRNITFNGKTYIPDSVQGSFSFTSPKNSVLSSTNSSAPSPIYQSARVFSTSASYKFDIKRKGRHWIRLHFFPLNANLSKSSLTVMAENFLLLHNFSFEMYNDPFLFKEYAINLTSNTLEITFFPVKNSVIFINAIEVVSIPDSLIPDQAASLSPPHHFKGISELALETVYRVNIGGPLITPQNDSLGRTWENDAKYLHINGSASSLSVNPSNIKYTSNLGPEIAPNYVYSTADVMGEANVINVNFNITWVFTVDPDFSYFIRVHFCDIWSKSLNSLIFNLYINTDIAFGNLDLSSLAGNLDVPYYRDFVLNTSTGSSVMTVSVGPDTSAYVINAIANGVEIMKISNSARSFTGFSVQNLLSLPRKKSKTGVVICSAMAALIVTGFCVFLFLYVSIHRSKEAKPGKTWPPTSQKTDSGSSVSLVSSEFGRFFTFQEIMDATSKFDESLLLGIGGFGRVYKGLLQDETIVAVKRGNPRSEQGIAEFRTEIDMLSKLRHRHLVSLIGYCDERSEMILVYEFMANGPLRSHLYGTDLPSLTWKQRLEICIGAATGLHYLHTGAAQRVIHRDVKTTNILLDENWLAKVADFGLSKTGATLDQTHVSTAVKGSFGYLDPEYFRRQQITEKSDVYSFGVVLMEVLCSRPALNPLLPREEVNIAEWGIKWQKKGKLDRIMDEKLVGRVSEASLKKFGEIAGKCLAEFAVDRPSMGDVLWNLEYALQLDETSSALMEIDDNSTNHIHGIPFTEQCDRQDPANSSVSLSL